jgi:hypothetical protein
VNYAAKNARSNHREWGLGKPASFELLGFTHTYGTSRAGGFLLMRHSSNERMRAKLHALRGELRKRMPLPAAEC